MACEGCPLANLAEGDELYNVYISSRTLFGRAVYRINCPKCPKGHRDFLTSKATVIADTANDLHPRYETVVQKMHGQVQKCGKSPN